MPLRWWWRCEFDVRWRVLIAGVGACCNNVVCEVVLLFEVELLCVLLSGGCWLSFVEFGV